MRASRDPDCLVLMKQLSGITLLDERKGKGMPLTKATGRYNTRIFLNQGDEVPLNAHRPITFQ